MPKIDQSLAEIAKVIEKMDRMRAAWPDFRGRVGYITATQDLEAACRKLLDMPAKPFGKR